MIGQEQDKRFGGYEATQSFTGKISEFNVWSRVLEDSEIDSFSNCQNVSEGDLIAWDSDFESWTIGEVEITNETKSNFCPKDKLAYSKFITLHNRLSCDMSRHQCSQFNGYQPAPIDANDFGRLEKEFGETEKALYGGKL